MQCHGARHGDRAGGPDAAGVTDTIGPVTAALKLGGVSIAFGTWPANNWTPGSKGRVALRVDNLTDNRATGVYPYVLEVTITTASGSVTSSATGQFVVVNVATGLLCAGWALAGLERLDLTNGARLLWYNGDGNFRVYTQRACSVAPNRVCGAPSASYPDSIREVAGTYVRLLPDSVSVTYGSIGEHLTTRNAKGHVTTFVYDAFGRPSQIAVPPDPVATALTWTFDYGANGLLASITAPGDPTSRMVTAHLNAATVRPDPDRTAPIFPKASRLECAARQVSPPSPLGRRLRLRCHEACPTRHRLRASTIEWSSCGRASLQPVEQRCHGPLTPDLVEDLVMQRVEAPRRNDRCRGSRGELA